MILGYIFALLGATSNATSNVLQRKANREESPQLSFSPRLIWDLIHRKVWLAGLTATVASFLLQGSALNFAALAAVQPVIAFELPLTLIGSAWLLGAVMHKREWMAIVLMTGGLGCFIGFLRPVQPKHLQVSEVEWALGLAASVAIVGALIVAARSAQGITRAALLGCAAGMQFGVTAALMKGTVITLASGIGAVFSSWTVYVMVLSGIAGMLLMQSALSSGPLVAAQPGITLLDPLVSIVWGLVIFGEGTSGGWYLLGAGIGAAAMALGAVELSRSPVLAQPSGDGPVEASDGPDGGPSRSADGDAGTLLKGTEQAR